MDRFWCLLLEGQAQEKLSRSLGAERQPRKVVGKKKEEVNSCATRGKVRVWGEGEA